MKKVAEGKLKYRTNLFIEPGQLEALHVLKEKTGVPIAAAVRVALRDYLAKHAKDLK
jgi:hypothetical protein